MTFDEESEENGNSNSNFESTVFTMEQSQSPPKEELNEVDKNFGKLNL